MYDDVIEEEERFEAAIESEMQVDQTSDAGIAWIYDDPSAEVVWVMGNIALKQLPPHVGRQNRFSNSFMDLLVLFMNLARRRGDETRLAELNDIYRSALGVETVKN